MKTNLIRIIYILFLLFTIKGLFPPSVISITVDEIMQELICPCGCNMVSNSCEGAMECSAAGNIKGLVLERLKIGQSRDEILKYFISAYGEKILSAPTKKGFNLTAWVLPFLALFVGGGFIYFLLKKWFSRGNQLLQWEVGNMEKLDKKYIENVRNELMNFKY